MVIIIFGEIMKKIIFALTLSFLLGLSVQSANAAHCAGGHDKAKETSTKDSSKEKDKSTQKN